VFTFVLKFVQKRSNKHLPERWTAIDSQFYQLTYHVSYIILFLELRVSILSEFGFYSFTFLELSTHDLLSILPLIITATGCRSTFTNAGLALAGFTKVRVRVGVATPMPERMGRM